MKLHLSNAQIFDPASRHHLEVIDILIENGQISEIGKKVKSSKAIDLGGKLVVPGFVDLFSHFNEPGFEHKEDLASGIASAIFGGFTDVCLIPNTYPVIETKSDITFLKAKSGGSVDLHPIAAISEGTSGENLTEILDLEAAGAVAFSDGLQPVWNSELLLKALQYVQKFDGLVINRPKDIHLSQFSHMHEGNVSTSLGLKGEPSLSEEISIKRDLDILRYTGGRIHFSQISSAEGVDIIKAAKKEGLHVTCDVSIHHLVFTDKDLEGFDSNYKLDPPLRTTKDRRALIAGLKSGVIDAVVSSHQPQDTENKSLEFDLALAGICSLPTVLPVALSLTDELPFDLMVSKLTSGPRSVLGLEVVRIEKGGLAKLAVLDPGEKWLFNNRNNPSKSNNSPFFGRELTGKCKATINRSVFSGIV